MAKRVVKPKKRCCKSHPRCKKCPVVCKRLVEAGLAERGPKGAVLLHSKIPKKALKAARV